MICCRTLQHRAKMINRRGLATRRDRCAQRVKLNLKKFAYRRGICAARGGEARLCLTALKTTRLKNTARPLFQAPYSYSSTFTPTATPPPPPPPPPPPEAKPPTPTPRTAHPTTARTQPRTRRTGTDRTTATARTPENGDPPPDRQAPDAETPNTHRNPERERRTRDTPDEP